MKKLSYIFIFIALIPLFVINEISALEKPTHYSLNGTVVDRSGIDGYLRTNLGFVKGVQEIINGKEVKIWIQDGGEKEDEPFYTRSFNHFHNPLLPWDNAGYGGTFKSSILWAQDQGTFGSLFGGNYSWKAGRDYYYLGLISTTKDDREKNLADTFRGLGQLMHLVEDSSVPAHTRNDGHVFYNYEKWVLKHGNVDIANIGSTAYGGTIQNISNLFDIDRYNGNNSEITLPCNSNNLIGLSEYTNANFFSEDTINASSFTYPRWVDTTKVVEDYRSSDGQLRKREYYRRTYCSGTADEKNYRLAAGDFLDYYREQNPDLSSGLSKIPVLDNNVYSDYASLLLPRAVGYSAGLLNYFFRGTLEITAPDTYVYSIIDGSVNPQQFTKIKAKVKNTTPNEQMQAGVLQAMAKYKKRTDYAPDLSTDPPTLTSREPEFSYSVSAQWTLSSTEISSVNAAPTEFTFDFTNNPIPAGITDLYLIVVFKGTLGNEADTAIAAGMKDIIEPMHHVFWNLTDMVILYYQEANDPAPRYHLYTEEQIRSRPELESIIRQNNIWAAYLRPHDMTIRVSYSGISPPQEYVSPIAEAVLPGGRHMRLIILLDREDNNYMRVTSFDSVYDNDQGSFLPWGCMRTETLVGVGDDIYNGQYRGTYCDSIFSSAGYQERDGVFRYQEASIFRTFKQHLRSLGKIWISPVPSPDDRYYPDEESIPADTTPYQATINFE